MTGLRRGIQLFSFPLTMLLFFPGLLAVQQAAAEWAWNWTSYGLMLVGGLVLLVRGIKLTFNWMQA